MGEDTLGVCFDTANALRVGDEPLAAPRRLAGRVLMVHLKGCRPGRRGPIAGPPSVPCGTGVVPLAELLDLLAARASVG